MEAAGWLGSRQAGQALHCTAATATPPLSRQDAHEGSRGLLGDSAVWCGADGEMQSVAAHDAYSVAARLVRN
jgi:hypothetical protein